MTEIEKMFENAGIKKVKGYYCPNCETKLEDWFGKHTDYICPNGECDYVLCGDEKDFKERLEHLSYREKYPPFTAEKQLEIIKLISKQGQIIIENWEEDNRGFNVTFRANSNLRYITMECVTRKTVKEALARIVNDIWQDLTDQEKEEIRNILNENS